MNEWNSAADGGFETEYDERSRAVSQFFGTSGKGYVDSSVAQEFDKLYAEDNDYNHFSRFIDCLKIAERYSRWIFPLVAFVVGEILLFVLFYLDQGILVLNSFFANISAVALYLGTAFNAATIALVIFASRILFRKTMIPEGWLLAGLTSAAVMAFPGVAGWLCIIPVAAVFIQQRNENRNFIYVSLITVVTLFGLMGIWARYFSYHRVVLLGTIIASLGLRNISIIPILIFSSVSAILSYTLMLNLSRLTLCFKRWVFYIFVAVYGLLSVIAPAVTFIISFIYTFVLMCIFVRNAGAEKDKKVSAVTYVCFMMASTFLLPANFPAWLTIAITVIGFIVLMILYRNRGLMNIQRFRFSWWMVLGFSVLAAGMLTHINFNWESFLPNFLGVAPTGDGSEGSLSAPQILLLSSSCVIVLFMIIFTAKGATSFSGIVCPIYSISGAALSLLLMNLLVSVIPGFAEGFANFQVFIVILIGIAFAIPCAIFQVIIWAIARNLRSDY